MSAKMKKEKNVDIFSHRKQILKAAFKHPSKETEAEFITQNFLYRMDLK